jgi:hypothetical protein
MTTTKELKSLRKSEQEEYHQHGSNKTRQKTKKYKKMLLSIALSTVHHRVLSISIVTKRKKNWIHCGYTERYAAQNKLFFNSRKKTNSTGMLPCLYQDLAK